LNRQHSAPILLTARGAVALSPLSLAARDGAVSEADIQALVHDHPSSLPIAEIDPMFIGAVAICRELNTPAGPIDNFLVTPSGLPVLVECKLWRNPQGRREVVGQILDYAKELSRWSSSDLQREVCRVLKRDGDLVLDLVRQADPNVDEIQFNDALTANLRRGRFLLLILGDGIREGVEAIAEYLQAHAGLHFSLGLVEYPIYSMPNGDRLVAPRVLARTNVVVRDVVALPDGYALGNSGDSEGTEADIDPDRTALTDAQQVFWGEFLTYLKIDDPEQPIPRPPRQGFICFTMPAPQGSSWLTVYRDIHKREVGLFLSAHRNTAGDYAMRAIAGDWEAVKLELDGTVYRTENKYNQPRIIDSHKTGPLDQPAARSEAFTWLAERVNTFVNVMRPRVRSAVADYEARGE